MGIMQPSGRTAAARNVAHAAPSLRAVAYGELRQALGTRKPEGAVQHIANTRKMTPTHVGHHAAIAHQSEPNLIACLYGQRRANIVDCHCFHSRKSFRVIRVSLLILSFRHCKIMSMVCPNLAHLRKIMLKHGDNRQNGAPLETQSTQNGTKMLRHSQKMPNFAIQNKAQSDKQALHATHDCKHLTVKRKKMLHRRPRGHLCNTKYKTTISHQIYSEPKSWRRIKKKSLVVHALAT